MHRAAASAMRGAVYGDERLYQEFSDAGWELRTSLSTAPDPSSAERAAVRLARLEGVDVLIGGFGDETAMAIADAASMTDVPFINAGSGARSLRAQGGGHDMIHVAHEDRDFIEAMVLWNVDDDSEGEQRWSTIAADDAIGRSRFEVAATVLGGMGVPLRSEHWVDPLAPDYNSEVQRIVDAGATHVIVLVGWHGQWDVMSHAEARDSAAAFMGLPDPVTQTREYVGTSTRVAPNVSQSPRFSSWESTAPYPASRALSDDFGGRWRDPLDGTAWGALQALSVVRDAAVSASGATWTERLRAVSGVGRESRTAKQGPSFWRPGARLGHSVHVSRIDPGAEPGHSYAHKLALAEFVGHVDATGRVVPLGSGDEGREL